MDGAESLLDASAITIRDAQGAVDSANGSAAGGTVQLIGGGLDAADTANSDLLAVLNNTYTVLEDVDALLRIPDTETLDQQLQSQIHRQLRNTGGHQGAGGAGGHRHRSGAAGTASGRYREPAGAGRGGGRHEPPLRETRCWICWPRCRRTLRMAALRTNRGGE